MEALLIEGSCFGLFQMACGFRARINPQFNCTGNFKRVAGFKKETELYPYKHRSKSPISSTFSFNRYPTQLLNYLRFNYDCGVCGSNKESTS